MGLIRRVEVVDVNMKHLRYVEGDWKRGLEKQLELDLQRQLALCERMPIPCGRNRVKLEAQLSAVKFEQMVFDSRRGEDRSWKYNHVKPRGRTLCKRLRLKAQYH